MKTYTATASRWERGWEIDVHGVGVTAARKLNEATYMATDYIEIMTGEAANTFRVELRVQLGGDLDAEVTAVRTATSEAQRAQEHAARQSRQLARQLKDSGLTGAEVATVLGVTPGRVSQLLTDAA